MKNWIGLLIALSLGIVAAVLNWQYLEKKSREVEIVSFLALDENVRLKAGDTFLAEHFVKVDIPRKHAGALAETAVLYEDRNAVTSMKALHEYRGGEIILRQELKTPAEEFKLNANELALWIPVNSATFVPSLVRPGDMVSFVVTDPGTVFGGIAGPDDSGIPEGPEYLNAPSETQAPVSGTSVNSELVGPFRVLSLGDRLGSYEVDVAANRSRTRENVMGVAVVKLGDRMDPKAEKLVRWMAQPDFRQAGVVLHPREVKK